MAKSVCVIGAGPSGLSQLIAFRTAAEKGADIPDVVCYEKQADWGGLWNCTWRTGVDGTGNPCHGSMYRHLWSNGPKEAHEFANYTFDEHFGRAIPAYPPRDVLRDYVVGRAKKAGIRDSIQFNTLVRDVRYSTGTGKFSVLSRNSKTDSETTKDFDYVIVCSGHFSAPNFPYYKGFETFNGRLLHAHDFRDAREFVNQDILVIGSSYSAEDIGSQCWKFGCKSVTISYRGCMLDRYDWPENWQEVPQLVRVEDKTAFFEDGTSKVVDAIILCTGYVHHFPFLPDDLRLKTKKNRLAVTNLYKGVVWVHNTKFFYIGMQDQFYTFNLFDPQAWYVRDVIMGRIALPSNEIMAQDPIDRQKEEDKLKDIIECIHYQSAYVQELIADTDYPSFNVNVTAEAMIQWLKHKKEGIMTFRDRKGYVSPITGTLSTLHHTPWTKAMDDSLATYLQKE